MKSKLHIVVGFLIAAAVIVLFNWKKPSAQPEATSVLPSATPEAVKPPKQTVEIPFVYSTEKKDWMEVAVAAFTQAHPEIKVTLVGKGSLEASEALLDGSLKPVLWSPAD